MVGEERLSIVDQRLDHHQELSSLRVVREGPSREVCQEHEYLADQVDWALIQKDLELSRGLSHEHQGLVELVLVQGGLDGVREPRPLG